MDPELAKSVYKLIILLLEQVCNSKVTLLKHSHTINNYNLFRPITYNKMEFWMSLKRLRIDELL